MSSPIRLPPGDPTTRLDARRRRADRALLADGHRVDVLVIGAGVTGTGVALDAASRGLSVALVERQDLASGTSSRSSKLAHGGLRYLAKGDVAIAWESAVERAILAQRTAPHLVHPMPQVVPVRSGAIRDPAVAAVGFAAGRVLQTAARTPSSILPRPRLVDRDVALALVPALDPDGLRGAVVNWECQLTDDARLVVALARTAAGHGARIVTRTEAISVTDRGASVRDTLSAESYEIHAGTVVNATGAWADRLDPGLTLAPSTGSHAVLPSAALGHARGSLTVPVPGEFGRFLFTLPQDDGTTYLGITDTPLDGPVPFDPEASDTDIGWIIDTISAPLRRPLEMADVIGSYAGVRPLVVPGQQGAGTADISRRHLVRRTGNLITVTGGKLTTYRRMAQDVVDLISGRSCRTRDIALVGACPPARDPVGRRYGSEAGLVRELIDDSGADSGAASLLRAQFVFARDHELALLPDDLVDRRTRLGVVPARRQRALPLAADVLAAD